MSKAGGSIPNSDELATYLNNSEGSPIFQYVNNEEFSALPEISTVSSSDYWITNGVGMSSYLRMKEIRSGTTFKALWRKHEHIH